MTAAPRPLDEPLPTWYGAVWFQLRAACFQVRRSLLNLRPARAPRHARGDALETAPVLGAWRSDLWREQGDGTERLLELGKVHNLRLALRRLDGS